LQGENSHNHWKAGTARKPGKRPENWNEGSLLRQYIFATKHPALIADADQIRSVNNETVWILGILFVCRATPIHGRIFGAPMSCTFLAQL
jgi:hypothetical protein